MTRVEIEELGEFLLSDHTPKQCMDISMLEGIRTCLVIDPEMIPFNQWLPTIWDETEDDEMVWETDEDANRILDLVTVL